MRASGLSQQRRSRAAFGGETILRDQFSSQKSCRNASAQAPSEIRGEFVAMMDSLLRHFEGSVGIPDNQICVVSDRNVPLLLAESDKVRGPLREP